MSDRATTIDPTTRQRQAADPAVSAWVSASAGSGKTKVLTDRVLSLLLAGVRPEQILCITFTKAAATEMAGRVNARLGRWATADEATLVEGLELLLGRPPEPEEKRRARRLFAQVLDAPGGLAIQTVHSFCQSLLGRFPAEAGVPPQFDVLDDRSATELMEEARDTILRDSVRDQALADAVARITAEIQEDGFAKLLSGLAKERGRLDALLAHAATVQGGLAGLAHGALGSDPAWSDEGLLHAACAEEAFDGIGLRLAAESLIAHGSDANAKSGRTILSWLAADPAGRIAALDSYRAVFLTSTDGSVRKTLAVKAVVKADPAAVPTLTVEGERLIALDDRRARLAAAETTLALAEIGRAMLARYARLKRERARLDYDDLILKARQLLTGVPGRAEWVLYKLDGGIAHILVDEAQDTNPDQWEVIRVLSEEFFAGRGQHDDTPRTVFAVGDAKQSIYSFQRADPAAFSAMRALFSARSTAAGLGWREVPLTVSFRSTDAVLDAVDAVFAAAPAADGVVEPGTSLKHTPHRAGMAGQVTLWPLIGEAKRPEPDIWQPIVEPDCRIA
jgi:ATP-dependent helicase/nuclease subunit A